MIEYRRLDEVCDLNMGQSPTSTSYNENAEGLPFFQGNADFGEMYPAVRVWCSAPTKIVEPGTLLISVRAPIGALNFASERSCIGRGLAGITAKSGVELKYIYYCLTGKHSELNAKGTGSTFKAIAKSALGETTVRMISLDEQNKVIQELDRISSIIAARKQQLNELDTLIKARFVEMFGDIGSGIYNYETCKLGDVASVGSSHRVFTTEFVESGIPFYRGTEIGELASGQKPSNPYYISEEHYQRLSADDTMPKVGDLLMPSICNKGQVWMVDAEEAFYYKDGRVLCISPDRTIFNSKFLQYFMREKTLVEYPKMGSGSTFAEFKIFLLKDMDVLIPPMEIQKQFASIVAQIDKSKLFKIH